MNPVIASAASILQTMTGADPTDFVWFDVRSSDSPGTEHETLQEVLISRDLTKLPMAFERMGFVFPVKRSPSDPGFIDDQFGVGALTRDDKELCALVAFIGPGTYGRVKWDGNAFEFGFNKKYFENGRTRDDAEAYAVRLMQTFMLASIHLANHPRSSVGHKCKSIGAALNARRIKKGKRPLYDWVTIDISAPTAAASTPKGGTHASPKPHERRGHMRTYKSGKQVFIKSMTINKHKIAEAGFVFHDYTTKA